LENGLFPAALVTLDEGFLSTSFIKAIEAVDSYELDIEAIYRRHSVEEMRWQWQWKMDGKWHLRLDGYECTL
jgi:hypothetical protein